MGLNSKTALAKYTEAQLTVVAQIQKMGGSGALFKSSSLLPSILFTHSAFSTITTAPHFLRSTSSRPIFRRTVAMASSDPSNAHSPSSSSSAVEASSSPSSAVDFLTLCHRLKTTKRAGWVRRGVTDPESIADHMYRMAVMALVAPDIPGADRDRLVKMAIVHDIAEAIVGDITPVDGVPKLEKSRMEREAIDHMCGLLGGGSRAKEIEELWMEYEENSSLEAKVVKDFDKVEMILQALEYEIEQGIDLGEFFLSTAGKFQTDVGKAWALEIANRRREKIVLPTKF